MASDPALVNDILRIWMSAANFNTLNPAAANPTQIDHFFEVQHITAMLFTAAGSLTEGNWFRVPIGYFVDLATCVSAHDNLYRITAAENMAKRNVTWAQYAPGAGRSALITNYLARNVTDGGTVQTKLQALAVSMANRGAGSGAYPYKYLTRAVGQQILTQMGWPGMPTLAQQNAAGDFTVQVWQ